VNVTELEVPPAVVIRTCTLVAPDEDGTVGVQAFSAGQLVGTTWPLNVATMWPSGLRKLAPDT